MRPNPVVAQLAPYVVTVVVAVGVIILVALGKVGETAGVGLLGVIVGGHGAMAIARGRG